MSPLLDRTGPNGEGPMTGRGMGYRDKKPVKPVRRGRYGRGFGRRMMEIVEKRNNTED